MTPTRTRAHTRTCTHARAHPQADTRLCSRPHTEMPKAKKQQNLMTLMRTFKCSADNDKQHPNQHHPPTPHPPHPPHRPPLPLKSCLCPGNTPSVASALNLNARAPQPSAIFVAFLCVLQFCFMSFASLCPSSLSPSLSSPDSLALSGKSSS